MQRKATSVYVPLHQLVLLFPLFLLCGSVFFDWLAIAMGSAAFAVVAFYLIAGGLIGGVIAVPFGLIDWFSMPTARPAPGVARFLAGANVMALMLFAGSWVLREPAPLSPPWQAYALAWAGALASLLPAWLGGDLQGRRSPFIGCTDGSAPGDHARSLVAREPSPVGRFKVPENQ